MQTTYYRRPLEWIVGGIAVVFAFGVGLTIPFVLSAPPQKISDRPLGDALLVIVAHIVIPLIFAAFNLVAGIWILLACWREKLVLGESEALFAGILSTHVIRFADVIEAHWLTTRRFRLRLRTATEQRIVRFELFKRDQQDVLVQWFRAHLDPGIQRDWEAFQTLREERPRAEAKQLLTVRSIVRLLGVVAVISLAVGAVVGVALHFIIPNRADVTWSGSLIVDWSLRSGWWGLLVGISFLGFILLLQWLEGKLKTRL